MTTQDPPPPPGRRLAPPQRPGRPEVALQSAPVAGADQHAAPSSVATSFWLWIASVLAGLAATAVTLLQLDDIAAELEPRIREQITARQLTVSPGRIEALVDAVPLGALGAIATLIVLQLVLAALMRTGRGWTRGPLVVTVLLSAPALLVTQDLVSDRTRLGFLLQGVLMIVAAVMMFLRDSNEWFRNRR